MISLALILATALAGFTQTGIALPEKPIALEQIVDNLVRDLGSERYDQREAATKALRQIGSPAMPALEKAAESDDPEVAVRARKLLLDLRLGITPDWPAELALQARHVERIDEQERYTFYNRLAVELKDKAIVFLVNRLKSSPRDAELAANSLRRMESEDFYRRMIELIGEPGGPIEERVVSYAKARLSRKPECSVDVPAAAAARQALEDGVKQACKLLAARQHKEAAELCAKLAKDAPADARPLYLHAEALTALEKDAEGEALRKAASALNPDSEAPHYAAGQLLMDLGRRRLAAGEWQAILAIPPEATVYDVNACLRLSSIYEASGLFLKAAESLAHAIDLLAKASEGGKEYALLGGTKDELAAQLSRLRNQAERYPAAEGDGIEDEIEDKELRLDLSVVFKDATQEQFQREMENVAAVVNVTFQPAGLRIFDVAPASLTYDSQKKQAAVTLNGTRCGEWFPLEVRGEKARVAVASLDGVYIFEVDAASGKAKNAARFEKDYSIKFQPGLKLAGLSDVVVMINDKRCNWEKLLQDGIAFDVLPDVLSISLEGTTPTGRRISIKKELPLQEPELQPGKPQESGRKAQ